MNAKRITTFIDRRFSVKIYEVIVIKINACICLQEQLVLYKVSKAYFVPKEKLRESSYDMQGVKNAEIT
jgi:hypothetical protein